jgi:hypothetical protein
MFDKIGTTAERVAIDVSRRSFFGCMGRWAAATVLGMAVVLASAGTARGERADVLSVHKGPVR